MDVKKDKCIVFDLDGTLCEIFYGENDIGLYGNPTDAILRNQFLWNSYEKARPIPPTQTFVKQVSLYVPLEKLYVMTLIHTGHEYENKVAWVSKHFPMIPKKNILGVPTFDGKMDSLRYIASHNNVSECFYIDDNVAFLSQVYKETGCSILHSSFLIAHSADEFVKMFK